MLCNHHPYLITEHFHHPTNNSCPPHQSLLTAPPPTPGNRASAFHLCGFACLDISYKWNCTLCGIWGLASSTQHSIFEVHPHRNMYQSFIPFLWLNNGFSPWLGSKESAYNSGAAGDMGSIPGWGRSPGGGHGNPLQ